MHNIKIIINWPTLFHINSWLKQISSINVCLQQILQATPNTTIVYNTHKYFIQ